MVKHEENSKFRVDCGLHTLLDFRGRVEMRSWWRGGGGKIKMLRRGSAQRLLLQRHLIAWQALINLRGDGERFFNDHPLMIFEGEWENETRNLENWNEVWRGKIIFLLCHLALVSREIQWRLRKKGWEVDWEWKPSLLLTEGDTIWPNLLLPCSEWHYMLRWDTHTGP